MKKAVIVLLLLVLSVTLPTHTFAANELKDGRTVSISMGDDDYSNYTFNLKQPSRVKIRVESEVPKLTFKLKETNGATVPVNPVYLNDGRKNNPQIVLYELDLNKGEYLIELHARYDSGGGKVKLTYSTGELDDGAQRIPLAFNEQVEGFIVRNHAQDIYQIELEKDGFVNIFLNGLLRKETSLQLLDERDNPLLTKTLKSTTTMPAQFNERVALTKGTYYIKVYNRLNDVEMNTGKYTLQTSYQPSSTTNGSNNTFADATPIYFGGQVKGMLGRNNTTDFYSFTVPTKGDFTVNLVSRLPKSTTLSVYNQYQNRIKTETRNSSETNPYVFNMKIENAEPGKYYINVTSPKFLVEGGEYSLTLLGYGISTFNDYDMNAYWTGAFAWSYSNGIVQGQQSPRLLKPYQRVTEAQTLAMMFRHMFGTQDSTKWQWYDSYYDVARAEGLDINTTPNAPVRRGDVAKMLAYLYTGTHFAERDAIQWLYDNNITTGKNPNAPKDYANFAPNELMVRAHLVSFMHRADQNGIYPYK